VHEDEFLRVSNRHAAAAPAIEERPGRYLGYFENKFGEQLVFVHEDGELDATVFGRRPGPRRGRACVCDGVLDRDGVATRRCSACSPSGVVAQIRTV